MKKRDHGQKAKKIDFRIRESSIGAWRTFESN